MSYKLPPFHVVLPGWNFEWITQGMENLLQWFLQDLKRFENREIIYVDPVITQTNNSRSVKKLGIFRNI